jgi:D-alanyl-lipoteichoic acid acyltransferase DltB (MBOAT superfamily)
MLFNSVNFALFLPIVFILYWFGARGNLRLQNIVLLFSSYFFYACWDWRFLFLLIFSISLDYFTGIKIYEAITKRKRALWLSLSIGINLGFLGIFKYYNFFAETFANGLSLLGMKANLGTLDVILPVGISFYTFHGLSYVIDLYKNKIVPERNFINYSLFVSFFPLLVAGPIERATHLLPQVIKKRDFDYSMAVNGLRQILWGLFKKIVIADNCAEYANLIFNNSAHYSGSTLVMGALFFTFQIYADFSGYSDIAIGTAHLFGIDLLRNFAFPYFSRDIAEFWRRWHISLSSWFRDYLYIPLGGSKGGIGMKIRNTFIIFIASGFWHGANWTFIAWGALNAIYFLPLLLSNKNRNNLNIVARGRYLPNLKEIFNIALTFSLTVMAWIFFRATDIGHALQYMKGIFNSSLFSKPDLELNLPLERTFAFLALFIITEWLNRENQFGLEFVESNLFKFSLVRKAVYIALLFLIFTFPGGEHAFIYFQF